MRACMCDAVVPRELSQNNIASIGDKAFDDLTDLKHLCVEASLSLPFFLCFSLLGHRLVLCQLPRVRKGGGEDI